MAIGRNLRSAGRRGNKRVLFMVLALLLTTVRYGQDAQEIVDHAKDRNFDLIAMSTHGRTGLGQFVLGSVASKVIHTAIVPILLCRVC